MQFFVLDLSRNGLEGFRDLGWVQSSLTVHVSFFTSFQCQCSKSQNKDIFPRKVLSHLHMLPPLLQPHLVLSHSVLFPTILGWLHPYQCMRHTRALYLLGFYEGKTLFAKKQLFFVRKLCLFNIFFCMNDHSLTCFQIYL